MDNIFICIQDPNFISDGCKSGLQASNGACTKSEFDFFEFVERVIVVLSIGDKIFSDDQSKVGLNENLSDEPSFM